MNRNGNATAYRESGGLSVWWVWVKLIFSSFFRRVVVVVFLRLAYSWPAPGLLVFAREQHSLLQLLLSFIFSLPCHFRIRIDYDVEGI